MKIDENWYAGVSKGTDFNDRDTWTIVGDEQDDIKRGCWPGQRDRQLESEP